MTLTQLVRLAFVALLLWAALYACVGCQTPDDFGHTERNLPTAPATAYNLRNSCAADDSGVCMCCCSSLDGTSPTPLAYYHGERWLPSDDFRPKHNDLYQHEGGE